LDPQWKFRNEKGREHIRMMGRTPSPPANPYGNHLPPTPNSRKPSRLGSLNEGHEEPSYRPTNSPQRMPPSNSPQRYPQYQPRPNEHDVSPRGMPPQRPMNPYAAQPPPKWQQPDLHQRPQRNGEPLRALPKVLPDLNAQRADRLMPLVDPAVQVGLDDPIHERSRSNPEKDLFAGSATLHPHDHRGFMSRSPQSSPEPRPDNNNLAAKRRSYPPAPSAAPQQQQQHTCRGCALPIAGRSLKDSSGRLTGRYHRDCFRCTTCAQPFPSGEFYVLADAPYCGAHYHERNGSCCSGCRVGIEGAYLETDDRRIYHPACFRCDGCGCALAEEYWELDGKTLCHRHNFGSPGAGGPAGGAAGQKYPERRRTKLVNGMGAGPGRKPFF
jgi:hypothetical protein